MRMCATVSTPRSTTAAHRRSRTLLDRFRSGAGSPATALPKPASAPTALPLPDKPSIAVLPFKNMSGDPEQEYFADGIVEDIITALSRFKSLFVIARNSSSPTRASRWISSRSAANSASAMCWKGAYARRAIGCASTGQLDRCSESGNHLWADRYEGGLEDVFDLQDAVTAQASSGRSAPRLERAEMERTKSKPTESLGAYDCTCGRWRMFQNLNREACEEVIGLFRRA